VWRSPAPVQPGEVPPPRPHLAGHAVHRLADPFQHAAAAAAAAPRAAAPSGHALPPRLSSRRLDEAEVADLVAALAYALRFDARGKPRKGGWDFAADLAAEWIAEHLRRSNFVVLRRPPGAPHSAG
jgi:hypothetical protein